MRKSDTFQQRAPNLSIQPQHPIFAPTPDLKARTWRLHSSLAPSPSLSNSSGSEAHTARISTISSPCADQGRRGLVPPLNHPFRC